MSTLVAAIRSNEINWRMLRGRITPALFLPRGNVERAGTQRLRPEGCRYSLTRLVAEDAGGVGAGGAPSGEEAGS